MSRRFVRADHVKRDVLGRHLVKIYIENVHYTIALFVCSSFFWWNKLCCSWLFPNWATGKNIVYVFVWLEFNVGFYIN